MITLHTFGPMFGLPDPSPFVTKTDVMLKMSGIPFQKVTAGMKGAPKGKLPFIEDDGVIIADSTLIRLHLEKVHHVDFDPHLSPTGKGIAWSVEKMLEDHLYWAFIKWRWLDDENFEKGPAKFFSGIPGVVRPLIKSMVRRSVRKNLHAHGLGRHTEAELTLLANRALDALSQVLGDKQYLMGEQLCGADATAFAFVLSALCPVFDSPARTHAEELLNLVAYRDRLQQQFYPQS
jgi:glutathione S-transferase